MLPEDLPSSPTAVAGTRPLDVDVLQQRYGQHFPAPAEELLKRVEFAAQAADERALRAAFDERRKLYADRTGPEQPKPVRQKNLTLLQQLEALAPALEQHLAAVRVWRSLAEAAELLAQQHLPRCRLRLKDAAALLEAHPHPALRAWWQDLAADAEAPAAQPMLAPPHITSARVVEGRVGEPFAYAIEAAPAAEAFSAEGVPAGLHFDRGRGTLTGAPLEAGTFVVQLGATNASGVAGARLTLTVRPAPVTAPPLLVVPAEAAGVVGQAFVCAFALHPPDTTVEAVGVPAGLVLDAGARRLAGVPVVAGEHAIDVIASGPGGRASARLVLRVAPAPTVARPPRLVPPPGPWVVEVGTACQTAVRVEPAEAQLLIEELPPGLVAAADGTITGVPAQAGYFVALLTAHSAGGVDRGVLRIEVRAAARARPAPAPVPDPLPAVVPTPPAATPVPSVAAPAAMPPRLAEVAPPPLPAPAAPGPALPPAPPEPAEEIEPVVPCQRITFTLPGRRRLHVFAGAVVRAGRLAESDLPLVACWPGNEAGTVAINREISRKHCEFALHDDVPRAFDGWREGGAEESVASTFGTFVDAYRAATSGTVLRSGQIVKLTGRAAGKEIPHWRVTVIETDDLPTAPAVLATALAAHGRRVQGLYLRRLDLVADDLLLLAGACDLQAVGALPASAWLWRTEGGFRLVRGSEVLPVDEIGYLFPGATVGPYNQVRTHTLAEAIQLAVKR